MCDISTHRFYRMSPIFPVKRNPTCKAWGAMVCIISTYNKANVQWVRNKHNNVSN